MIDISRGGVEFLVYKLCCQSKGFSPKATVTACSLYILNSYNDDWSQSSFAYNLHIITTRNRIYVQYVYVKLLVSRFGGETYCKYVVPLPKVSQHL
jgi:hypothetical protein